MYLCITLTGWTLLLLHSSLHATETANDHSVNPRQVVDDRGVSGVQVVYQQSTLTVTPEEVDNALWHRLQYPGYTLTQDVGQPQLPAFVEMVMVPEGATFSWSYDYATTSIDSGFRVYPALAPATDRYGDPEPSFAFDTVAYNTNAFWPESPVRIVNIQDIRGVQVIWFDIMPVAFNPVTGEIRIYEGISLDVSFSGASRFMDYAMHTPVFLNNFPLMAVNGASVTSEIESYMQESVNSLVAATDRADYIILTDSLFMAATEKFADWKRQLGYAVDIVASTGWTFQAMRDSVVVRYQNWIPRPDFVLVIGDHDRLPAQMLLNPDNVLFGSDLHLVTMGQHPLSHIPAMAKGRLSVISPTQAMTVVDKIIQYEKSPPVDTAFYRTGLNCAQFQDDDFDYHCDRRFVHTSEEVHGYLSGKGYTINRVYYADTTNSTPLFFNQGYYSNGQSLPAALLSSSFNWKGNAIHIRNHINNGAFYVLHRDHGFAGGTGWHAPYYVSSHINQLTNGSLLPVVFSINCHTGEFTLPECFAERFLRHHNGGAVGVVAASYYSYSGWNDGLTIGMFDAIWGQPGLVPNFGAGGIQTPSVAPHPDIRQMGHVLNHGLIRMTQTWSSALTAAQYQYRLMHYFGDPAMRIRTEVPQPILAHHADTMYCDASTFPVSNVSYPNAVATLTIPGKTIGSVTLSNGNGTIPVSPFTSPWVVLTISGPEHIPYIDTIGVIPTPLTVTTSVSQVKCNGKADGSIRLTVSCGIDPISVSWAHGPVTREVYGLSTGTYHFTVTDGNNHTVSDSVVLTGPATPIQITSSLSHVQCYYGNTGTININVQGGVPPYDYLWTNGGSGPALTGLNAGSYVIVLTDSAGCIVRDTFNITQPVPLTIGEGIVHDAGNCSGAATALPNGGTPPYTFLWNDPDGQTTQTAVGLCPGTVRVWVTDNNQCVTVRNFTILNTSGISELQRQQLLLFPNPLDRDELTITLPAELPMAALSVRVMNALGQEVYRAIHHPEGGMLRINPYPVRNGISFVIIHNEDQGVILHGKVISSSR
jgi:hypothetical protein